MAITFTNLGLSATPDFASGAGGYSFSTSSWTPPTSGLIILFVGAVSVRLWENVQPTVSGNSLTWVAIKSVTSTSTRRLTLFGANASGSTPGTTTISFTTNQNSCVASFFRVDGTDVANGVLQTFVQSSSNSGSSSQGTVTLAAASSPDNREIAAFIGDGYVPIPAPGWTAMDTLGVPRIIDLLTEVKSDAFVTTVTTSFSGGANWAGIAAEIKAASSVFTPRVGFIL